jgi:hypothetical protein
MRGQKAHSLRIFPLTLTLTLSLMEMELEIYN